MIRDLRLTDYTRAIAQRPWTIFLVMAVAFFGSWLLTALQPTLYSAETSVLIRLGVTAERFQPLVSPVAEHPISNEARFAQSDVVIARTLSELDGAFEVSPQFHAQAGTETDEIVLTAIASTAALSVQAADTYTRVFLEESAKAAAERYRAASEVVREEVVNLESQLAELPAASSAVRRTLESQLLDMSELEASFDMVSQLAGESRELVSAAELPEAPVSPDFTRNLILALVLGTILGVHAALILDLLDTSITKKGSSGDVTSRLPNLGSVPRIPDWSDPSLARVEMLEDPSSEVAESFRGLRTALEFSLPATRTPLVLVTSPNPGDGKTTVAVNVALSFARTGRSVLLVDANLRAPRVHEFFGLPDQPGLTTSIVGGLSIESVAQAIEEDAGTLRAIPSGELPPGPSELLGSDRALEVFTELRSSADLVVIDSPAVLRASDPVVLTQSVDCVLLVVDESKTGVTDLRSALDSLSRVDATPVGTILNAV